LDIAQSFRGHVALPLEVQANQYMENEQLSIRFSADMIETGSFVTVMLFLLCHKYGRSSEVVNFCNSVSPYIGLSGVEISFETAVALFEQFKAIYNEPI